MVTRSELEIKQFKGIRNDENSKNVAPDYLYKLKNYNYPDTGVLGLEKILMPDRTGIDVCPSADEIDGMFEYRYLDSDNVLNTEYIVCSGGVIWRWNLLTSWLRLKTGLTAGKVSFAVFQDKLFIANGKDNVQVYDGNLTSKVLAVLDGYGETLTTIQQLIIDGTMNFVRDIASPFAEYVGTAGSVEQNRSFYYTVVYTTAGGDDVIGDVSNVVMTNFGFSGATCKIKINLPLGYTGVTGRKLYRKFIGDGYQANEWQQITTSLNTTDTTYDDNTAISGGSWVTLTENNTLPLPYFLSVANSKLYLAKVDKYPTQLFISETNIEAIDLGNYTDIAGQSADNTPIQGMGQDFNKIIIGTNKNIFLVDPSDDDTVILTRANVGIKNGYTVKTVPAFGDFPGGMMFLSTLNDIRIMSGIQQITTTTTLDNVRSESWSQAIRGELETQLAVVTNLYAEFYKYRYHLIVNGLKFVFDIRTQGWTEHEIKTTSYTSTPIVLAVLNNYLYNGQADGWIEQEYGSANITYRGEDVEAYLESPHIAVDSKFKLIEKIELWFIPSTSNEIQFNIITDDNSKFEQTLTFSVLAKANFTIVGGAYTEDNFSTNYFDVDLAGMDYRVININRPCRWLKWTLVNTKGNVIFQGFKIKGQDLLNRESAQQGG